LIIKKNERNIIGLFITNVLTSILGFVSTVVLAHYLSSENLGNYYIITSIVFIIVGISQAGLRRSIIFHTGKKIFDLDKITANLFLLIIFISIISFIISFFILNRTYNYNIFSPIIFGIALYIPTKLISIHQQSLSIGVRKYKKLYLLKIISAIALLVGLYLFLILNNTQLKGAIYSQVLAGAISLSFGFYFLKDVLSFKIKFDKNITISLIKHGVIFGFAFLIMKLIFKVDLYIIKYLLSSKEAGIYATGVSIVEQLWLFAGASGIITFAETANNSKNKNIPKTIKSTLIFTLITGIILYFISDIFINTFFGEKFIDSINVIKILLPGVIIFSIFKVLNGYFSGIGKVKIIIYSFSPILILNVLLNFYLIPKYGINGAAISSSISYSLGVLVLLIIYLKHKKVPHKMQEPI